MKTLKLTLTALLIALSIISCKKDEKENPQPQQPYTPPVAQKVWVDFKATVTGVNAFSEIKYFDENGNYKTAIITSGQTFNYTAQYDKGDYISLTNIAECTPGYNVIADCEIEVDSKGVAYDYDSAVQDAFAYCNYTIPN